MSRVREETREVSGVAFAFFFVKHLEGISHICY